MFRTTSLLKITTTILIEINPEVTVLKIMHQNMVVLNLYRFLKKIFKNSVRTRNWSLPKFKSLLRLGRDSLSTEYIHISQSQALQLNRPESVNESDKQKKS